jgi:hypothetical protein
MEINTSGVIATIHFLVGTLRFMMARIGKGFKFGINGRGDLLADARLGLVAAVPSVTMEIISMSSTEIISSKIITIKYMFELYYIIFTVCVCM